MERESSLPRKKKGRMDAEALTTGMLSFCYLKDIQNEKSMRWLTRLEIKQNICVRDTDLQSSAYREYLKFRNE